MEGRRDDKRYPARPGELLRDHDPYRNATVTPRLFPNHTFPDAEREEVTCINT